VALSEIKDRDHDEKQEELRSYPQKNLEKSNTETKEYIESGKLGQNELLPV
jgi:hypothetical protein